MAEDTAAPPDRGDAQLENTPEYPRDAKPWRKLIEQAEKAFEKYQSICDDLAKDYADASGLAGDFAERRFQMLYANLEVVKPSIYSRPPQPVVVPRFKDRKPVPRKASEILERAVVASFDTEHVHETFLKVRDDLALFGRGVCWQRYDIYTKRNETRECVKYDWVYRKDFLHEPARSRSEVGWKARGSWLTQEQGLARFKENWKEISYIDSSDTADEYKVEQKARVWEIWSKTENVVVWIHPNSTDVLDIAAPHLDLDGFFPCHEAYGSLEPGTLIPCPDPLFYKDQLDEIDELTARISALSESLKLVGFYAAGQEDLGDAIQTALKIAEKDNRRIAVPLAGMSQFGGEKLKDAIVWLPVVEVATTVKELVALRRQLIEDVYQISGISDIMRGQSEASETLGAQQLKSQYGSIRIKDRQSEMVRLCDAVLNIAGEIMAENFSPQTIMAMSQTDDLPSQDEVLQQHQQMMMQEIQAAVMQVQQAMQQGQPPPDPAQIEQAKQAIVQKHQKEIAEVVTVEKVFGLLQAERMRPFVLQIATDSTIQPDENAEKQARNEFGAAFAQATTALSPLVQTAPAESADFVGEMLKFMMAPYRAGRPMEQAIDDFVEQMKEKAKQPPPPNPEVEAMQVEAETKKADLEDRKAERAAKLEQAAKAKEAETIKAAQDAQRQAEETERKRQDEAVKRQQAMEDRALKMQDEDRKAAEAERKAQHDGMMRQIDLMMARITMETERLKIISMAEQAAEAKREKQEKEAQNEAKEYEREAKDMARQAEGDAKSSKRDEAMSAALASLSQGLETVAQAQQALAESLSRPKTIKFNAEGRPVGIQ